MLTQLWNYAAACLPEIADDLASIDRAMRTGFNWEMGPFEMWDAVGVKQTIESGKFSGAHSACGSETLRFRPHELVCRGRQRSVWSPLLSIQ